MTTLFELSPTKLNQLTSLEPLLDKHWKSTLTQIVLELDADGQAAIYKSIIEPKGIRYDRANKQFVYQTPNSLQETLKSEKITNKLLLKAVEQLLDITNSTPPPRKVMKPSY